METKDLPIGFIDSGFGGLTVARQNLKQLPHESIIYVGDSARAPYGPLPFEEVRQYIWQMTNFLLKEGIKMLVVACNTGTAAALEELRQKLDIPVVGVIHAGSRAAIKSTKNQHVAVLGTEGTIKSQHYQDMIANKDKQITVEAVAAPEFVTIVEAQQTESEQTVETIQARLNPLVEKGVDTIILGCTHYPILRPQIQQVVGDDITLVDSGVETINEVSMLLDYFDLSRTADDQRQRPATATYYTTGDTDRFQTFARRWLNDDTIDIKGLTIQGDELIGTTNRHK